MKSKHGPLITDAKHGEAFKVLVGSLERHMRRGSVFTYNRLGDELILWVPYRKKWYVKRVIYNATRWFLDGVFERAPYCPKCQTYLPGTKHDCNNCHVPQSTPLAPSFKAGRGRNEHRRVNDDPENDPMRGVETDALRRRSDDRRYNDDPGRKPGKPSRR